jgi:ferredoxin--NADP+ reductase
VNSRPLRVTIVGAGPAGIFTAGALTEQDAVPVEVHILDRLPTPFGLVRHGVAPDHTVIRDVRKTLQRVLERDAVRFTGNVEVGSDVSLAELEASAHAVVLTYGAARDRSLGIPGEQLPGSVAATDLVSWYCGHPDTEPSAVEALLLGATSAVVVGVGNVALDLVRILAKGPGELDATDMPQHVLQALADSRLRDIHLVGRRSPARAKFTTKELRELGELPGVGVRVDPRDLELDPVEAAVAQADKVAGRNLAILQEWSERPRTETARTVHLHFWSRPREVLGTDRVQGLVLERTVPDGKGGVAPSGDTRTLPAQLLVRSVGYRSVPLYGLPFDPAAHVIPNHRGRVVDGGAPLPGRYVAGWLKRGPSGVIGTNKMDALETVGALLEDAPQLLRRHVGQDLAQRLAERGLVTTDMRAWRRIDDHEVSLGSSRGRARTTVHDWTELLSIAGGRFEALP